MYNHLTAQQIQQLHQFKHLVHIKREWHLCILKQEEAYWKSQIVNQTYPEFQPILESFHSLTDDQISEERELDWEYECLRFLRANKWNTQKAVENYNEFINWRKEKNVDQILHSYPPKADLIRKIIPSNIHGFDRFGHPVYLQRSGKINPNALLALVTVDELAWFHIWIQELQTQKCKFYYRKNGQYVDQFVSIFDLAGFHFQQRKAFGYIQTISKVNEKMYPKRMAAVYIVNVPAMFPLFFRILKPLIYSIAEEQVHVIGGNFKKELSKHFDPCELPPDYGGTCNKCPTAPDCIPLLTNEEILASLPGAEASENAEPLNVPRSGKDNNI